MAAPLRVRNFRLSIHCEDDRNRLLLLNCSMVVPHLLSSIHKIFVNGCGSICLLSSSAILMLRLDAIFFSCLIFLPKLTGYIPRDLVLDTGYSWMLCLFPMMLCQIPMLHHLPKLLRHKFCKQ